MARTPLMRWIKQLADVHAAAERQGCAPEDIRHDAVLRRRDLLKGSARLGLALAAARPVIGPVPARSSTAPRIAIVGAGIAGLSAALELQDAGYASTIYEATHRLGGRMHSDRSGYWDDGQVSEFCGELIDSRHLTIRALAKRFGLTLTDLWKAEPAHATDTYYFFDRYYSKTLADIDFGPVRKAAEKDLEAAGYPTLWNKYNQAGYDLDHMSVYDWIESRVPGGVSSSMGSLLNVAYNEEYGAETTDQSALNILYLLAYQPSPEGFAIYGESNERYHISGGNQLLPLAIAATLPDIRLGWRMTAVSRSSADGVALAFESPDGPKTVVADTVILTTPFSVLRTLDVSRAGFDGRKLEAINELGSGRNSKLMLQFNERYWNGRGPWGVSTGEAYTDIGFQNTWDTSRGQPGLSGLITNYTGGDVAARFDAGTPYSHASQNPQVAHYARGFCDELDVIFPGVRKRWNGKASLSTPFRDPNLRLSYSYWRVGQYTSFAGYERAPQGPIHFAGEHCSINYQGYMEGGAEEGLRAAKEVLRAMRGETPA
jgi:monoamine oxidase